MAMRPPMPDIKCMDPENYRKYFRALCWNSLRKSEKRPTRKLGRKEKLRRLKATNILAVCHAPRILPNPSQFAVYATVRKFILTRWRYIDGYPYDFSDDSDDEYSTHQPINKVPKITGIGLRAVFTLISQARFSDSHFCEHALKALLDVLQGHAPEELAHEPPEMITSLQSMLVEIACGNGPSGRMELPSSLTAISSSCLMALSVARGEAELILSSVASLIMAVPALAEQSVKVPYNLTTLQRSVQSVILGPPCRNQWLHYGVPHQSLASSFPVDLPPQVTAGSCDLVVRSLVSDGCFLYVYTSRGLLKIGSGYGSSIKQHVYMYKPDFFASDRHGWLGYCKNKLYVRIGRKKPEVYEVDKETLEVRTMVRLEPGPQVGIDQKSAVFTDGKRLGLVMLNNIDVLTIKMYDVDTPSERPESGVHTVNSRKEINVHLLRRRTLALGKAPFEDGLSRRAIDLDAPVAMQFDDTDDDPLTGICAGQDFGLLSTRSGKVYYTGKGTSLGYKMSASLTGRWTLMKETVFNRHDPANPKKCKVIQVAVGHEGVHAILVLDNGTALFTGVARRGEDGDTNKHRRSPKPTRPRKILKADGHHIVYAACNYGSTALVTRQGLVLMFGKDTQHCDANGIVAGLRHERVIQIALGKAHAVALTNFGQVYTFGINNKGQCGREFGYTKERPYPPNKRPRMYRDDVELCTVHTWYMDFCRVCSICKECTGFFSACHCSRDSDRIPGERCGCGEGDTGCTVCGVCRRCAELYAPAPPDRADSDEEANVRAELPLDLGEGASCLYEGQSSGSDSDKDSSVKLSCLPPARIAIPGGHRIVSVACGLHHTVLLVESGEVLTFGSNQYGALGAGDVSVHHRLVRVRVPRVSCVVAGSNHTAVLTREGEVYTFGAFQKGALGRPRLDEPRSDRGPIWFATPGRVPRIGPRYANEAVWISASGDQTFLQVSQTLIKTDTIFSATITANSNTIIVLPNRPEHTFKCITINKADGSCNSWTGPEQVDFVNTLACLDPLYDVLWCYQPGMRLMKCYNILAFDSHKLQRCCFNDPDSYAPDSDFDYPNYGTMRRLEDFKNLENFEFVCNTDQKQVENMALSNMSILNQELAIPCAHGCSVTRMHAALHLLGCLDSLTYAHDVRLATVDCKRENPISPILPALEDYLTVNRFESHGGGWGYSGHSVEAIRFMCDNDILLGGIGLYGGRGDYAARIKLFDIGPEGGEQENDGDLLAETDEINYECPPRDRFPVLFENPILLAASRWYVAWACINGPSSDCGSNGQAMVINDDVGFHFKTSKKSNNGTDVNAGQIPCLLYNVISSDHSVPIRNIDFGEPVIVLSKNISRKVTVNCFRSLINLLQWSWNIFKDIMLDTNGQVPINYNKLTTMKHQKRLVYVIRACIRLVKSYTNEIYPKNNRKRNSHEYMPYLDIIGEARNFIQGIMADPTPTCSMLPRKAGRTKSHRICYVQFALEMTNSILNEAHETVVSCFHAFFPNPALKWNYLCSLLYHVKDGVVPLSQIRALTATSAAMCDSRSLCEVLQYIVPITQNCLSNDKQRPDSRAMKDIPSRSATVPRSSHSQKPPPIPPRANRDNNKPPEPAQARSSHEEWHLMDAIPRLLDVVMIPIKQQMMTRQCGQPHDHGEIKQRERLTEYCCKLTARIVGDLTYNASNEDMGSNTVRYLITPSRFMRVNQSRVWNTGNGTPDAICFSVDRVGIALVGACIYGGTGTYDYTLELLHDVRLKAPADEANPSHCWVSVETVHGTFTGTDLQHDMVQIKFERPIPLKEELRYALRLCNQGARTASGDCGLPSVNGPDGTTFTFTSCSLSFNGTSLARGQIPCLIYQGSSKSLTGSESGDRLYSIYRGIALRVAAGIMERGAELFAALRNELTAEDLRRNAAVLHHSPVVNTLLPYTLANLDELDDPMSAVRMLEMIHELLPHVAAMNLLVPPVEELTTNTTSHYYTWVESEHPYKQAIVSNMRVLFPPQVSWIVLEMDPRSITAQPEDSLTVYAVAGAPKHKCHCTNEIRIADPPFRKVFKRLVHLTSETGEAEELEDANSDAPCTHYNCTYVSVTPRLSNVHNSWPKQAVMVPGNEVIFSLETASDYLNEYSKPNNEETRFGFRCLCVGYEDAPFTSQKQGLTTLEMELVYAGASCASRLLAPDVEIPPLQFSTIMELQMSAAGIGGGNEMETSEESDALLLARGLELSSPPSVHHVLDGLPLMRSTSTERKFLSDFVAGAESTAGGRLACWLAPAPRVVPTNCEMKPPATPIRPATKVPLPVIVKDQYGEIVTSPALKIEVVVQRLEEHRQSRATGSDRRGSVPDVAYNPVVRETMTFKAITMMKVYQNFSFEELRFASGVWGGASGSASAIASGGRVPAERLAVHAQPDGTYLAMWTPRAPGSYEFRCSLDNVSSKQELTIDVLESPSEEQTNRGQGTVVPVVPSKLKIFSADDAAALRVRASPSLQAEEIGRVPPGANIAFVEEVVNKDGTWVRLSAESIMAYASGAPIAWCMQYHRPYDRILLQNIDRSPAEDAQATASGISEPFDTEPQPPWNAHDEDDGAFGSGDLSLDERRFPFALRNDAEEQAGDSSSSSPFNFGFEPSKRARYESTSVPTPRRLPRRSNGNADDWWSPVRYRSSENLRDVSSMPEGARYTERQISFQGDMTDAELMLGGRLAQACTQTSPDTDETSPIPHFHIGPPREDREWSGRDRERGRSTGRRTISPPPVPLRAPVFAPRKYALAPAQAECLRAVFASLLRHEGIVADAIACAAFLKFHPHLPKSGAPVMTRGAHDVAAHKPQRHSVEVSNAGSYLRINPSTLESLTRSGTEASSSRARKADLDVVIREDEPHSSNAVPGPSTSTSSVVNVLPPALRALVALWDALCDSDQLAVATDKFKREVEANENEEVRPVSGVRRKKDSKFWPGSRSPYSLRCELCGGANVAPPLAGHMKQAHPGCRAATTRGYDRAGVYREADTPPDSPAAPAAVCGQLAQDLIGVKIRATLSAYQLWYIYCEKCRERSLKSTSSAKHKTITIIEGPKDDQMNQELDHLMIRDNALFLLDLAPLNNSEAMNMSPWNEMGGRSPPTPPGSVWQPAPPFQVLPALGAAPRAAPTHAEPARYHSLGRPPPPQLLHQQNEEVAGPSRVHRSVSMGQAGGRDLASAALMPLAKWEPDPIDTLPGAAGSSLLAQPSAALQKLVTCGEWTNEGCTLSAFEPPALDVDSLMRSPVMSFVLARKDLHGYRQKMDAAVRINTVRQYGFEALNWLLRSATQPTCVHDVMWWFCNTLDKYSRIMPSPADNDDNKENAVNEMNPRILQTPSASAICPGGRVARGARGAFHSLLGSVSALAPSLPTASAAGLQAVRCWALHYSPHDRSFLHRSQVFSVISKILSHSEEGTYEEGLLGAIHESYHSYNVKQPNYVWSCPDVTGWCEVAVSSRQGMAGALTDGSTETFWESGDEDRNKAKWIQIAYPGGSTDERPHVVCVHVDNTRDTVSKTLLISFLFSGGTSELFHMQDLEVDTKSATWICYTLPRMAGTTARVRCELRGPEGAVRVRQVRVLGAPAQAPSSSAKPPLHALVERDTLRVFRLLTSQVFGKLLEWEDSASEAGEAAAPEEVVGDDTDLREHVVGILFAGHKLTSLQSQVMAHIVMAIGCEAVRVRDDWETALLCAESAIRGEVDETPRLESHTQDNYCFEMLSMLLALSGSAAGRAHLAQRTELLPDLLALLHTGSERVQRQVISLLRRIIIEISPQKMLAALNFGNDIEIRVTLLDHLVCYLGKAITVQVKVKGASGSTSSGSITMGSSVTPAPPAAWFMRGETLKQHSHIVSKLLLDMAEDKMTPEWGAETRAALAQYVAAIAQTPDSDRQPARCLAAPTVWMALAALCVCEQSHIDLINSASEARKCKIETASANSSVSGTAPSSPARRSSGMSEAAALPAASVEVAAPSKPNISFECVAGPSSASYSNAIQQPQPGPSSAIQPRPSKRKPYRTVTLAEVVVEKPSATKTPAGAAEAGAAEDGGENATATTTEKVAVRRMCVNHDDGSTCAVIDCRTCGPLCAECDRFLHLSRVSKSHQRQICKEEESAIRVDIHEGCGRAKLFWLLLLVDRRTLKALAEFRGLEGGVCEAPGPATRAPLAGVCRYCGVRANSGLLAIGNVCADHQCQEHGRASCTRVLSCGHGCGGVRGERVCLPCLFGCGGGETLRQDADDMCMICFTDPLQAAPAIQLKCGHVFHLHCCKKVILSKWNGPRITFSFSQCPICKEDMNHWTLEELLAPIKRLKEEVRRKAMMRLEYEGLAASGTARSRALADPATYAMERYAYYVCHKCGKAYFGGLARCEAETNGSWEPSELVCGACSDVAGARTCPKHGADFLEYKCRYCCSVAVFFCFGTSHFCNACHDDFQRVTNIPRHMLPQCPAGPKAEQLPGSSEECPLHVQHPPTGEEFALGCGVCRHAHAF